MDVAKLVTSYYALHPDPAVPEQKVSFGTSGHRRLVAAFLLQRGSHRRHLPGHLRLPGAGGHHRAAVPGPGHSWSVRARVRDRAGGPRGQRRYRAGGQPGRVHADARAVPGHPRLQRRARRRPGRRDRDHPVAQPAGGRRVQVQPARRRPGRLADHLGHPGSRQRAAGRWPARGAPDPLRGGPARVHDGHVRLPGRVRRATPGRGQPGHHPRSRHPDRRRPAGRRQRRVLGRDRRAVRAGPDRGQPGRGRHVPVHDPGLGRPDPDGLLFPVRDGVADPPRGRVRHRDRQRHRLRPARHRHPGRRA